jgi:Ca-activated chloride channel family protein
VNFARPDVLPWLLFAPIFAAVIALLLGRRRRRLARAVGLRVDLLAGHPRAWRWPLFPAGVLFALIALAQPLWGEGGAAGERLATDLVICLDVSRSMLAEDVEPSRLERAKAEIESLAARAAGDRLALVVFAGEARLVVPLTRDLASLARMASLQDPLSVATGGSDLGAAIDAARGALDGPGAILLLTDGEDLGESGLRAARRAREAGVEVACMGFGSPLGAKIPDGDGFVRDEQGREVVSRMDPDRLRRMADGAFAANGPVADFYENRIRATIVARVPGGRANRYQWPLALACVLWILEWGTRR